MKIFNPKIALFLESEMCINVDNFESNLTSRFGGLANQFEGVIDFLMNDRSSQSLPGLSGIYYHTEYKKFKNRFFSYLNDLNLGDDFFEFSYVMLGYFSFYYNGGLAEVFKRRQADDLGPQIELRERILSEEYFNKLPSVVTVYRGMSPHELNNSKFGMSWSFSEAKAKEFAFYFYSKRGVVVMAKVPREMILHHYFNDSEEEIVIPNNSKLDVSLLHK